MGAYSAICAFSLLFISVSSFLFDRNSHDPNPTEQYPYHKILDLHSKYHLFWKFNTTHITFEAHVRTRGYVGLGLASKSKMYPADIVIGWVKDGVAYLKDRHSVGHFEPLIDQSQDWILLHGEENDFGTVLKMVRLLETCDDNDYKITEDTVRVLYSYHADDPTSEIGLPYHGVHQRGAKSLMLLSEIKNPAIPADAQTRDFLNSNYSVPNKYTTYHCTIFDLSELTQKHHVVKFEPIIEPGHEVLVHHIVIYRCPGVDKRFVGSDYVCYENKTLQPCGNVYLGWAVGGEAFYFPEDVGMPVGEPGEDVVYILETHYNNPEYRSDFIDSSGLRVTYTPTLRRHDAGMLTVGISAHPYLIIPPHEKNFVWPSICMSDCLSQGLQSHPDGVNVFALWHHGHLIAEGIKTRHIRNGIELEPLAVDEHYDFDYQDYRHIHKKKTLKAGDSLMVECTYDSSSKTNVTNGGLSTADEMCYSFILYYPRMPVEMCVTIPAYNSTDIRDYSSIVKYYDLDYDDPAVRSDFKDLVAHSNHLFMCFTQNSTNPPPMTYTKIDEPSVPYTPPSTCHLPIV